MKSKGLGCSCAATQLLRLLVINMVLGFLTAAPAHSLPDDKYIWSTQLRTVRKLSTTDGRAVLQLDLPLIRKLTIDPARVRLWAYGFGHLHGYSLSGEKVVEHRLPEFPGDMPSAAGVADAL